MANNRNNTGVLFTNAKKEKETHPDFKGNGNFEGVEFEISAWEKTSEKGTKYLSISFSKPYDRKPSA